MTTDEDAEVLFLYALRTRRRGAQKPVQSSSVIKADPMDELSASESLTQVNDSGVPESKSNDGEVGRIRASTAEASRSQSMITVAPRSASVPSSCRLILKPHLLHSTMPDQSSIAVGNLTVDDTPTTDIDQEPVSGADSMTPMQGDEVASLAQPTRHMFDWRKLPFAPPELVAKVTMANVTMVENGGRDSLSGSRRGSPDNELEEQDKAAGSSVEGFEPQVLRSLASHSAPVNTGEASSTAKKFPKPLIIDLTLDDDNAQPTTPQRKKRSADTTAPSLSSPDASTITPKRKLTSQIKPGNTDPSTPSKQTLHSHTANSPNTPQLKRSIPASTATVSSTSPSTCPTSPASPTLTSASKRPRPRPWTSKMYTDLMQKLQQNFPFTEFAQEHNRTRSEVFEVFSALVQQPLLKHSSTEQDRISYSACKARVKASRALQQSLKTVHREEDHRDKRRKQAVAAGAASTSRAADHHKHSTPDDNAAAAVVLPPKGLLARAIANSSTSTSSGSSSSSVGGGSGEPGPTNPSS